tara:strand:- start:169 stop:324 length:156 start_codon:yes stop_codon:yes gene_type:complete
MAVRKIVGLGKYSAVVSIPRSAMQKLGWRKGQKVVVSSRKGGVNIKDFPNK